MTTIRKALDQALEEAELAYIDPAEGALSFLGIDPDLPAEWATEERCREWLDVHSEVGCQVHGPLYDVCGRRSGAYYGEYEHTIEGETEHAALIAACQAVKEASA